MAALSPLTHAPPQISRAEFIVLLEDMGLLPEGESRPAELARASRIFERMDTDNSGKLSAAEFMEAYHQLQERSKKRWRGGGGGGGSSAGVAVLDLDEEDGDDAGLLSGVSTVVISAVRWYAAAGAAAAGCQPGSLCVKFPESSATIPEDAMAQLDAFVASCAPLPEAGAPRANLWVDVSGPLHPPTLAWLRRMGLTDATGEDFRDEGVYHKGVVHHPLWPLAQPGEEGAAGAGAGAGAGAPRGTYAGVLVPYFWLANTPFKPGAERLFGFFKHLPCCALRGAAGGGAAPAPSRVRHSLHWWLCGSRKGTVYVAPADKAPLNMRVVDEEDHKLAAFWAIYVSNFVRGRRNVLAGAPSARALGGAAGGGAGAGAPLDAEKASRHRAFSRFYAPGSHENSHLLVETMTLGGEFHLRSKRHLREQPPHLVRSVFGVFLTAEGGPGGVGAPAVVTMHPYTLDGVLPRILEGYQDRLLGTDAESKKAKGAGMFVEALSSRLLAAALVDSVAVRYNDLAFRLVEHWAAVVEVCVNEAPTSLHQRHMELMAHFARKLGAAAAELPRAQAALKAFTLGGAEAGGEGGAGALASAKFFYEQFERRAAHLAERAAALERRVEALRAQYMTRLDEDRNWMLTALTLFTAATWPLSFLTGYFGMNFDNMVELFPSKSELPVGAGFVPLPVPGVKGIQIFWIAFAVCLVGTMLMFQRCVKVWSGGGAGGAAVPRSRRHVLTSPLPTTIHAPRQDALLRPGVVGGQS